jgi:hypothetical protein
MITHSCIQPLCAIGIILGWCCSVYCCDVFSGLIVEQGSARARGGATAQFCKHIIRWTIRCWLVACNYKLQSNYVIEYCSIQFNSFIQLHVCAIQSTKPLHYKLRTINIQIGLSCVSGCVC